MAGGYYPGGGVRGGGGGGGLRNCVPHFVLYCVCRDAMEMSLWLPKKKLGTLHSWSTAQKESCPQRAAVTYRIHNILGCRGLILYKGPLGRNP